MEEEKIIVRPSGTYGRLNVTMPMTIKKTILRWAAKSGLKKAEFIRMAMMIGAAELAERVKAKSPNEGYGEG